MTKDTVSSLAALVGGRVLGDGSRRIVGVADLRNAGPDHIGFVRDTKYREMARTSRAGALITPEELDVDAAQVVVGDVGLAFARVASHFHPMPRATERKIHPTAVIADGAELDGPVEIGPQVVVGRARIGAGTVLMSGVSIGDDCRIGRDCVLYPRVVCYHGVVLGDRVCLHSGTVVGSDGFGYAKDGATFVKVPQFGGVRLDDDVEIGANCTIDRGAIGDTHIRARTKIDNLCHIAHNSTIGRDCAFAAGSLIAGSTVLGDRVILAGHCIVGGHLHLVDDVRVGGNSCILRDINHPGDYMGHPLTDKKKWFRIMGAQRHIVELRDQLDALREEVDRIRGDD